MFSFFTCAEEKKSKTDALKRWGVFLGVAVVALFLSVLPFIIRGNYLAIVGDGVTQHATFLEYMFKHGLFSGLGEYDYNIGLGADYAVSFAYYTMFDPINFLLYILPRSNFLLSYSVLACIRFLICAICMYVYLRGHKVRQPLSVVFSVAYMLSGYMLYTFTRHPCLTAGAMYLPLITLGLEKAIDKNNPFVLIIFTFLTTVSSFYMAYMVTVYSVLYAILYYVNKIHAQGEKVTAKNFTAVFFRTAGYYAVGLLLAAFMLLPVAYGYVNAARSSGKGMTLYSLKDLLTISDSFFIPVAGAEYTTVMFNAITVILAFVAASCGRNRTLAVMSCALAIGLFIPLVGFAMNLFNYVNNRYTYMLSFCVYALIAVNLNGEKNEMSNNAFGFALKGFALSLSVLAVIAAWYGVSEINVSAHAVGFAFAVTGAVVLTAGIVTGLVFLFRWKVPEFKALKLLTLNKFIILFCAVSLVFSVAFNVNYSTAFDNGDNYDSLCSPAEKCVGELPPTEFVRTDYYSYLGWDASNRPINNGYKGAQQYNTVTSATTVNFLQSTLTPSFNGTLGISGFNGRTALEAVMCTKYFYKRGSDYVPVQFAADGVENLYVTDDYVRFGTVFTQTLNTETYNMLTAAERQYAMLTAVITDSSENRSYIPISYERGDIFSLKDYTFADGEEFSVTLADCENCETFVYYKLADYKDRSFYVFCGDTAVNQYSWNDRKQLSDGRTEFLIKFDSSQSNLTIRFTGNSVTAEEVKLYSADNDDVIKLVRSAAAQPHLTETQFSAHGFGGKINSSGGTMLIQLPYSKGWSAAVDGTQVKVLNADCGLMAIEVSGGEHIIEFSYRTPLLTAGIAVTVIAAFAFVSLMVAMTAVEFRRRRRLHG